MAYCQQMFYLLHSLEKYLRNSLDLHKMRGKVVKNSPNSGLMVIYHGRKYKITLNKPKTTEQGFRCIHVRQTGRTG